MKIPFDPIYMLKSLGGKQSPERIARAKASGHYHQGIFVNTIPTSTVHLRNVLGMFKELIFGREERIPKRPVPIEIKSHEDFEQLPEDSLRVTWMGHASVLIEIDGLKILADPVWSERVSPSRHMGPKRFVPPPIALRELKDIDLILISHDHYDHLDMETIIELAKQDLKILVPLGVGTHLEHWQIPDSKIIEMNWGDEHTEIRDAKAIKITATAARHFSGRGILNRNTTFWASFVIEGKTHKVFHTGDSGYSGDYKKIGDQFGPFDITLMQIGACSKYWPDVHMFPAQAVQAHLDLRGQLMIPIHWGTFNLAFHAWNQPIMEALQIAKAQNVRISVPKVGQSVGVSKSEFTTPWWILD